MVGIETLQYDLMHSKHLGTDAYFLGSVLVYMVDFKLEGEPSANLLEVWTAIKAAYSSLRSTNQFSTLTLSMFRAGQSPFPCLKGKAAEVKHLVPAMEVIGPQFLDRENPQELLMLKGLQQSRAIDACISEFADLPRHWE